MLNKQNIKNTSIKVDSCNNESEEKQVTKCAKTMEIREKLKIIFDDKLGSFKENGFFFRVIVQKFAKDLNKDIDEFSNIENTYEDILVSLCESYDLEPPLTEEEWLTCMGYIFNKDLKDEGLYTVIKCRSVYDVDCVIVTKSLSEAEHVFNKEMEHLMGTLVDGFKFFLELGQEEDKFKKRLIVCKESAYIMSLALFEE